MFIKFLKICSDSFLSTLDRAELCGGGGGERGQICVLTHTCCQGFEYIKLASQIQQQHQ